MKYPGGVTQYHLLNQVYSFSDKLRLLYWDVLSRPPFIVPNDPRQQKILVSAGMSKRFEALATLSINCRKYGEITFHSEISPYFYGCSCQHLMSKQFLTQLLNTFDRCNIFQSVRYPFSGEALEIIWGLLPKWLGYEKWFWNGIHRVRKNPLTLIREGSAPGMAKYLNTYYRNELEVRNENGKIIVLPDSSLYESVKQKLGTNSFSYNIY